MTKIQHKKPTNKQKKPLQSRQWMFSFKKEGILSWKPAWICLPARVKWRENRTSTLASIICITMGPDFVLIFVLSTAHCVTIIMCAAENSEMVIPWIQSNADSWNGSYFNFLHSMNIIYFDMCKWGFIHYEKLSAWIWGCSAAATVIPLKFTPQKKPGRAQLCLVKGGFFFSFWLLHLEKGNLSGLDQLRFPWIIFFIQHVWSHRSPTPFKSVSAIHFKTNHQTNWLMWETHGCNLFR